LDFKGLKAPSTACRLIRDAIGSLYFALPYGLLTVRNYCVIISVGLKNFYSPKEKMAFRDRNPAPPYGPTVGTIQALQLMRKTTPTKVDGEFLRASKIAPGNEYKVVGALRFLGLIDDNGRPTEKSRLLKTMGSTFTLALQEIVNSAYQGLFRYLDVSKATREDIYNYFITEAGLGAEMAAKASRFFITLCRMAQVELGANTAGVTYLAKKTEPNPPPRSKAEARGQVKDNSPTLPVMVTLSPEIANMDTEQLAELFRKVRVALSRSLEQ
jgi:hypothetical protein